MFIIRGDERHPRAPEFNQFVIELCRSVGFILTLCPRAVTVARLAGPAGSGGDLSAILNLLSPIVMSRAAIRPFPGATGRVFLNTTRPDQRPAGHPRLRPSRRLP
jgi:hypothetical protein